MKEEYDLVAEFRDDQGKGASRRLRRDGKVPAIVYGGRKPPRSITLDHNKVVRQAENEKFYSSVLTVKVGDKAQEVILKDIQRHPARRQILHLDFQRIVAGEKIRMSIPIHWIGEDVAPGVKLEGGVVVHQFNDLDVECLPKDLPEYIDVDVSQLKLDDMLHLSDVKVPEGVELVDLAAEDADDPVIVAIQMPRAIVEEEPEEAEEPEAGEVPLVGEEEEEEGKEED